MSASLALISSRGRRQRQPPDLLAGARVGGEELVDQVVVVAHDARYRLPERDDDAPVSVARSTTARGLEVDRTRQRVGEHEPPLGVGVGDLDRVPVYFAHDVARADRRADGFSGRAEDAHDGTGSSSVAIAHDGPSTAMPPDLSKIISPIFSAGLIEIPPVSKVMALPTTSSGPVTSAGS